jgi:hypothetical protein
MRTLAAAAALAVAAAAAGVAVAAWAGSDPARGYRDAARGLSADLPPGWHAAGPLSALAFPREVVTLASYPLRRGGSCGPDRALRDLGPHDALIFVMEYRPARGAVWGSAATRAAFPARPARLRLPAYAPQPVECVARPSYTLRFRDSDRPIQVHVALGARVTAAERTTVERVLDGLRFDALPPPPPDPFAGWPTLVDESGDSLRAPPRWTGGLTAIPRRLPRPRTLFLTASERLAGAPGGRAGALAPPAATPGLGRAGPAAVALWIAEERRGGPAASFPPLADGRAWARPQDLAAVSDGPAAVWPALRWRRAGVSWRGLRFSAWIAAGPRASAARIALAEQAAASVALSSGLRDCTPRSRRGACRRPLPRALALRREPYLGVRCPTANSIGCDRAGLAVWLRRPVSRLTATIDGRSFTLRPPPTRAGYWEGVLPRAGFLRPGAALHVTPDRGRRHWEGRHPVRAVVRLTATARDGARELADVAVDLRAGYG